MLGLINSYYTNFKICLNAIFLSILMKFVSFKNKLFESSFSFTCISNRKLCRLSYERFGNKYNLFLPYDSSKVSYFNNFQVYLRNNSNEHINITQQPGIPYLLTAKQMGGNCYLIIDKLNSATYETEDPPMYLEQYINNLDD